MPIEAILIDAVTGQALRTVNLLAAIQNTSDIIEGVELVTVPVGFTFGTFKSATRTTAGTTTITDPDPGGSIILTDMMISTDKTANSDITIRFTDGTDTINVFVGDSANAPLSLGIGFNGRWQGWKDARLEIVTVGAVKATVAVGYIKSPGGLPFAEWDSLR